MRLLVVEIKRHGAVGRGKCALQFIGHEHIAIKLPFKSGEIYGSIAFLRFQVKVARSHKAHTATAHAVVELQALQVKVVNLAVGVEGIMVFGQSTFAVHRQIATAIGRA